MRSVSFKSKTTFLFALAALCFALTALRRLVTGKTAYFFLNKNLLLALIPWALASVIIPLPGIRKSKIARAALFPVWLLFLPNAPYIVTDFLYLRNHPESMFWYDLMMIFLFAWTGLLSGFSSIDAMENALFPRMKPAARAVFSAALLFAAAFGVYLGRDLRWHSWDFLVEPKEFFQDVADRFINPGAHARTWSFTLMTGFFLNIMYWPLKAVQKET